MKKLSIIITSSMISFCGFSQNPAPVYLWPNKVPGEKEIKHEPILTPNNEGDVIRLTYVTNPAFLVFEPAHPSLRTHWVFAIEVAIEARVHDGCLRIFSSRMAAIA